MRGKIRLAETQDVSALLVLAQDCPTRWATGFSLVAIRFRLILQDSEPIHLTIIVDLFGKVCNWVFLSPHMTR